MRTFITFSDGHINDELAKVLNKSLSAFSKHPLRIYRKEDFVVQYDTSDPNFWASGMGYVYKVLSCLKAMEEYDEIVWIDTDCIATNYVDKIWFDSWRIDSYPLLPEYRFNMFRNLGNGMIDSEFLKAGRNKVGCPEPTLRNFYSQACFMLFNRSCRAFFEETLSYFNSFDADCFPNGDESIINCLLWKYGFNGSLGNVLLCSEFFGNELIDIMSLKDSGVFMDAIGEGATHNIFGNVLFLHGTKSVELASGILGSMTSSRLKKQDSLCEIMRRNGSDKSTYHNYTLFYDSIFSHMVGKGIDIFEMGLGTNNTSMLSNMGADGRPGASLRGWNEYFINANVYGADIDRDILFDEGRIKTFFCDQTSPRIISDMWNGHFIDKKFDIIIDDGLHEFHANFTFLECSIHKLRPGGIFVIEDLLPHTANMFRECQRELESRYGCTIDIFEIEHAQNSVDNCLFVARVL
jgi:SAM-dependent methyltransferase